MTKTIQRILSLTFALLLFVSIAAPASAANSTLAGIYIWVSGSCVKNERLLNILDASTSIKTNPDNAYLVTKIQYTDGVNRAEQQTAQSQRGERSFNSTFAICLTNDYTPIGVYSTHEVRGGTSENSDAYALYLYTDMTEWVIP